jgi:hypothetical protein
MKLWFPSTCTEFVSVFEEAAHHIHYNRLSQLRTILTDHKDLVLQVTKVRHQPADISSPRSPLSSHCFQQFDETLLDLAVNNQTKDQANADIASLLIECGADLNRINKVAHPSFPSFPHPSQWGNTPLIMSLLRQKEHLTLMLVEKQAASIPNLVSRLLPSFPHILQAKKSPLLLACQWGNVSAICSLLRRGDSLDEADQVKVSFLSYSLISLSVARPL